VRIGAVIVGRLGSSRLPGKVLHHVRGRPLLEYVVARTERVAGLDAIVVATSDEPGDDPIADWAAARGLAVHRGPRDDVLARMLGAAHAHELDAVARVNGDSPWLDPELLGAAVARMRSEQPDLVTNLVPRTWPYGIAAEVATVAALARAHAAAGPQEHATAPLYADPEGFATVALTSPVDAADVRLVVDTEEDLRHFERLVDVLGSGALEATTSAVVAAARTLHGHDE
jgi:spore coat polysaccharide biosynthesis protein SpsF